MFKLYYAAAIDTCVDQAFKQIEEFKILFEKYSSNILLSLPDYNKCKVSNPIEVYGAGFGDSPIIPPECSQVYKGVISAYDLRKIRECDVLLVVTDLKQFAAGTFMELEYARNLGVYTIILVLSTEVSCEIDMNYHPPLLVNIQPIRVKNIFLETYANKIIYSMSELEDILKDLTQ
jgi:hypothetical protein